ncbi:hypothetical protein K438DRAFT_1955075 [Mycena galopus ATCC 62051]|nr:hypothetical protein K438DRAFT_1955075 [Mycena galopus ATCC 62051]
MSLEEVLPRLYEHPSLIKNLDLAHVHCFLRLAQKVWPEIILKGGVAPIILPPHISAFLAAVLDRPTEIITLLWIAFGDIVAKLVLEPPEMSDDNMFRLHGQDHDLVCKTRYHPNYFVKDAESLDAHREYYGTAVPTFIHVTTSNFFEDPLCVFFEKQMCMAQ